MLSTEVDPCLLYRHNSKNSSEGLICLQVDDSIGARTKKFLVEENVAARKSNSKRQVFLTDGIHIKLNGQQIVRSGSLITQEKFIVA